MLSGYLVVGCLKTAAVAWVWSHEAFSPVPESINSVSDDSHNEQASDYDKYDVTCWKSVVVLIATAI